MSAVFVFWTGCSALALFVCGVGSCASHDPVMDASDRTKSYWLRALAVACVCFVVSGSGVAALSERTAVSDATAKPSKTGS